MIKLCLLLFLLPSPSPAVPDTIDNWQVYQEQKLLIAGNAIMDGRELTGELHKNAGTVTIRYNHDTGVPGGTVTLTLIDPRSGKVRARRTAATNTRKPPTLEPPDLSTLPAGEVVLLQYAENQPGGITVIVGKFTIR